MKLWTNDPLPWEGKDQTLFANTCGVCRRELKDSGEGAPQCKCVGLQPYTFSVYPGDEHRLVPTHPDGAPDERHWYNRKDVDERLKQMQAVHDAYVAMHEAFVAAAQQAPVFESDFAQAELRAFASLEVKGPDRVDGIMGDALLQDDHGAVISTLAYHPKRSIIEKVHVGDTQNTLQWHLATPEEWANPQGRRVAYALKDLETCPMKPPHA